MNSKIYVAGGCFWGVEAFFQRLDGVIDTTCGYANSKKANPTYEEVCSGAYQAAECVELVYDPEVISLDQLLHAFFAIIDPTSLNKQGEDVGVQYRTGVYYQSEEQRVQVETFLTELKKQYTERVVTEVLPLSNFYPAEAYHQDYLTVNPNGYCHLNLPKAYACMQEMGIQLKKK